jgi:hypothetical protein
MLASAASGNRGAEKWLVTVNQLFQIAIVSAARGRRL